MVSNFCFTFSWYGKRRPPDIETGPQPFIISYVTIHARNHIEINALPDVWNIFQEKNYFFMQNHIDSVGTVMFVERNSRHQETQAKKNT